LGFRKYFVGGFHSDVTEKELKNHFSTFGAVSDVKIMRDATSGRSRGFGFVTMSEPSSKQRIMAEKEHIIGGRKTSVRPYAEQADLKDSFTDGPILKRKVFVGGINPALGREALENYFGKYGLLEDATIMRYRRF
jgi:RNA recognition motif-containing protein